MARQLYINDKIIDLKDDKSIGLTFQIGSVLNPGNRAGNNTNKFDAPPTKNNNEIFESLQNINSNTNFPYQKNSAKYIQNGVELISDGFGVVESTQNGYKLAVYSGNTSFFDLIKGRNVNELDWSDSVHDFDIPTIISSFTNNAPYIYAMVDWGDGVQLLNNTQLQNSDALMPVLRISEVLERMAAFAGYELKGTFLDTDQYSRLILGPNQFGYLDDAIAETTGFVDDVTPGAGSATVLSVCKSTGANDIINIPLVYQNIQGQSFDPIVGRIFTPNNFYLGSFDLNAQGTFDGYIPVRGETIASNGKKDYKQCNINDSHVSYIANRPSQAEQLIFLYDIEDNSTLQLTANGTGGSSGGLCSMTEDTGGYVAWSVVVAGQTDVVLYEIATATTTVIYTNLSGTNPVTYLKVYNGKVVWYDPATGGGLKMYDIATATTKTASTVLTIQPDEIDHNGDYLAYVDPATNDVKLFEYTPASTVVIKNQGAGSGVTTLHVVGNYVTFWDDVNDRFESYKISTAALVAALIDGTEAIKGSARTATAVAFAGQNDQLYYYDLITDTLTTTPENDSEVVSDDNISMNDDNVAYTANNFDDVSYYNIAGNSVTNIESSADNKDFVLIGKSNVVAYHIGPLGSSDIIRQYDITGAAFFANIADVNTVVCFKKAQDNDRMVFTNDEGLSSSPLDRISVLNPIIDPVEVDLKLVIKEDGVIVYSQVVQQLSPFSTSFNMSVNTGTVYVKSGSNYEAELFIEADRDETIDYNLEYTLTKSSYSFSASRVIPYNAELDMKNFYNKPLEEVLLDVLNQYSLTIQTDDLTKQVFLTPLDDLIKNQSKAPDWSEKVSFRKVPSTKYQIGQYAQVNNLIYNEDEDVPADTGKGSFDIDDTKLPQEKDIIKVSAAAVVADLRVVNEHTPTIPLATENGGYFTKKKSRILLLDQFDKTVDFKNTRTSATGQATVDIPFCYFNKSGKTDNLDFQSLISQNYNVLLGMMDKVKFIQAGIRLSELDILNLDFTVPIYLDVHNPRFHANGYFYVNKITNFKENVTTPVQLIRL